MEALELIISLLSPNIIVFLIVFGIIRAAIKKKRAAQQKLRAAQGQAPGAAAGVPSARGPAPAPAAASIDENPQPQAAGDKNEVVYLSHRGRDGSLHPTEKGRRMQTVAVSELKDGFYQGYSFGDEGLDPCHDDMLEDPGLPDCDDDHMPGGEAAPAFSLRLSGSELLNGIIMSEVLNRKTL